MGEVDEAQHPVHERQPDGAEREVRARDDPEHGRLAEHVGPVGDQQRERDRREQRARRERGVPAHGAAQLHTLGTEHHPHTHDLHDQPVSLTGGFQSLG